MPEHDDLKLLEVLRAWTKEDELRNPPKHQVAERPEQEPTPQARREEEDDSTAGPQVQRAGTELTQPTGCPCRDRR